MVKTSSFEDILGTSRKKKKKSGAAAPSSAYTPRTSTFEDLLIGGSTPSGSMPAGYDYSTPYNEWMNSDEGGRKVFAHKPYVRPDADPRVDPFRQQRAADPLRPGSMFPPYTNAQLQPEVKDALIDIDPRLRYKDQRGGYETKMKSSEELARRIADAETAVMNMEGDGSEQARRAYADAAQKALDVMAGSGVARAGQKLLGALSSTGAATMELGAQGRENIPVIGKFNNMVTPAIDKFSDIVEAGDRLIGQSKPGDEEEQDRMMRRAAVLQPLNTGMTTIALGVPQLDSKRNWEAMIGSGAFGEIKDQMQKAVNMEYDDEFADSHRIAREFGVSPEHLEKRKVATLAGDVLNDYANFVGFGKSSAAKTASREVANSLATGAAPRVLDDIGRMAAEEGADDIARIGMEGYDFAKDMSTLAAEGYDPQLVQRVAEYAGAPKTAAEVSRLVDPNTVRGAVEANPRVMTNLFDQELRNAMKVLGLNPDDAAELASKSFGRGTPLLPKEEEAIALATTRSAKGYGLFGPDIPFVADDIRFGRRPAAAIGNVFRRPIPFIDTSVRDILRPQMAKMGELSELGRIMSRNRRTAAARTAVEAAEARSRELQREAQRAGDNRGLGIISDQLPDPLRPRMTPEPTEDLLRTADELALDLDDGFGMDGFSPEQLADLQRTADEIGESDLSPIQRSEAELQFNPPGSQAFAGAPLGAAAGIGEDEEGNTQIDWKKAILGAAGAGVGLSMLNRGKKAIAAGELEKVSMLANVAKGMTKGDPDTLPGIIKSLDEAVAAGDFGKKTPRLLDDAGTMTPAGRRFMKVMEHQDSLAEAQAKLARENNIPLNLVDNYQPAPLPSTGRRRKVNQRILNDINFGTEAVENLPKNDWFEQLRFGGKRRFGLPSKKVMREQANRRYTGDMLSSLTEDAANYNRIVNDPGRLEVGVQKKKSYPTPMSRARDGKLVEMNPYEAYASSEMMLKQLKAQNDQLLDLMGSRGTPISEEQAQKYLSDGIYGDRVFTDMNGNRFLVKDHDQAKTIREMIQTNDVRTQATPTGPLSGANRTLSSWVNPLMTTANPAFMFTNQLGNIILGARNGVGREMPEALRLVTEAWKAGGDTSRIADDATREMVELAEREGVLNALSLDPSTMWDYNVQSPLYNAPILGAIPRTVQRLNAAGEGTFRTAAFLEEMARNGGNASAARMYVDDVFFNYDKNALSAIEQGALGVMPFYNFTRRNLPATAEYYGKHPSRLDTWGKMQRNLGQEEDRDVSFRQENMPEYLHDQFTVRTDTPAPEPMMLPGIEGFPYLDQEWTPKMMDYSGVYNNAIANVRAPEVDALRIANIIEELSRGETKEASDFVGDLLGPAPQTLGQWVADADVPDTYGGGTARENMLGAIASQTPRTSTFFNAAAKAGKSEVKGGDPDANKRAFLNWLGPAPFYDYNPGAERRRGANIRESELNELVRQLSSQGIEVPEKSKARTTADEFLKSDKERYEEESKAPKNKAKEREYYMVAQYERWRQKKTKYKPRVDKRSKPPTEEGWAWMKQNYPDAYRYYRDYYKKRKLDPKRSIKSPVEEALGL